MPDRINKLDISKPQVVRTRDELRTALESLRTGGKSIGLVPTMGALHEGHLSLVDASRAEQDATVATIFVNPAQFGEGEDLEAYPRGFEADLQQLADRGVALVFAPAAAEMYRHGHDTYVEVGRVAEPLEGAARPIHFRGVATICLKLFQLVMPDAAYFGRKDYQQTLVVEQMVRDFDLPLEIRVCETVREADGLAMSSRNAYLTADERERALSLSRSLALAAEMVAQGERSAGVIEAAVRRQLENAYLEIDYVALVRAGTVTPIDEIDGPAVLAIAVKVGKTRLLDNRVIG